MPAIDTAIYAAEALSLPRLHVSPQWCTCVRNRASRCTACMDACPHEAILVFENEISIDPEHCTGCGACASACATQAITCDEPSSASLEEQMGRIAQSGRKIAFSCRSASLGSKDDERIVDVSCLAQLDEAAIAHAACHGISAIALLDGNCANCQDGGADAGICETVSRCRQLLDFWGVPADIARKSCEAPKSASSNPGQRRQALDELTESAKDLAIQAAEGAISRSAGKEQVGLASMLTEEDSSLRHRVPARNTLLLDDLYRIEENASGVWVTRLFAQAAIDTARCQKCGKCAYFCPTGALRFHGQPAKPAVMGIPASSAESFHTFRTGDCVNCGLCEDSCPNGALKLKPVNAHDLFELEPQTIS